MGHKCDNEAEQLFGAQVNLCLCSVEQELYSASGLLMGWNSKKVWFKRTWEVTQTKRTVIQEFQEH